MPQKRVLFVVNKWWECEAVMAAVLNHYVFQPKPPRWPTTLGHPRCRPNPPVLNASPKPRAVFTTASGIAEVWCISDLLEQFPEGAAQQSSSELKAKGMPAIFAGELPALVIAVGTAAIPGPASLNGSVVIGTGAFLHDFHPAGDPNPSSAWHDGPFDQLLPSALRREQFEALAQALNPTPRLNSYFLTPPLNPGGLACVELNYDAVALSSINVSDYREYERADAALLNAFSSASTGAVIGSVETTHGLIRVQSTAPFLFVSGVVDRVGHFADEVTPRAYAQNTVGAHNAGIVVSRLIDIVDSVL